MPDHGIEIPAYYVDHTVGEELLFQLKKMAGVPTAKISTFDNSNLTTRISVRVALMPADDVKPTAWELTLLVVLVILGTSIIFSGKIQTMASSYTTFLLIHLSYYPLVVTHIYLMKRNRRLHQSVERNRGQGNSRLQAKSLISYARLYQFPTRTIDTLPSEKEQKVIESVINEQQQKQQKSLFGISLFKKKILTTLTMEHPVNHMCVVCLEAFKIGDQVRKLPCNHEYHCLCIGNLQFNTCILFVLNKSFTLLLLDFLDPWLTSKSSECPLCKFDCSDPKTKDQVVDPDGLIAAAAVPGLKGKFVRLYRSIKSKARRHQVNPSTGMHDAAEYEAAPPSPGLRAAVMAIESMENQQAPHLPTEQAQNVDTTLADDRKSSQQEPPVVEGQSSAPQQGNHNAVQGAENNNASNKRTSQHAQNNEQKDHVQNSQAEHRDTDVASLSLCSIDLGGLDFDINK